MVYDESLKGRLMIGTPSYSGDVPDLLLPMMYGQKMPQVQFVYNHGCYVDLNRNEIIRKCYHPQYAERMGGEFTHLLMIDADAIPLSLDVVEKLLLADKDVIGGILTYKNTPSNWMVWNWDEEGYDELLMRRIQIADPTAPMAIYEQYKDRVLEVDAFGFGFALIKREVLDTMESPWFETYEPKDASYKGDDVVFCRKAQDLGFKIHVHTGAMCAHKDGKYYYPQQTQRVFEGLRAYYNVELKRQDDEAIQ